jgi:glycosyltransferase involved in cell wall biosynthesis
MWLTLVFGATAVLLLATFAVLFHLRWVRRLPSLENPAGSASDRADKVPVRCSVVLAARNEEARIENTVRRLLAQCGVQMEIIVVDDRSTDRTSEILRRLALEDARVRVKRVEVLPDGWLGKCHACHVGAGVATGDWILFTDADCWLKPDVIVRALSVAKREGTDHITLTPGVLPETFGARAWHLAFLMTAADWISGVNRDLPKRYLGVGAFNLVRMTAYRECGGYEALRLARRLLSAGQLAARNRPLVIAELARICRWRAAWNSAVKRLRHAFHES